MASITLRPAAPRDIGTILGFIRELAEYERAPQEVVATPESLHEHLFGHTPACEAIIGEIDGEPRGFALYFHNFSTWKGKPGLYLEDLYVQPACRGAGLGKALFRRVARVASERGCPRLEWAVLDWNTPAIDFYRSMGAAAMDDWTVYRLTGDALARAGA